jgi:hypothetical protein
MTEFTSPEQTPLQQPEAESSSSPGSQTVDPCHLYADVLEEKGNQLDRLIKEIGDLLQQLELCRRNGPGGANWLEASGSDAVHNVRRQLTLAALNTRAVYMTMRRPQQQATANE